MKVTVRFICKDLVGNARDGEYELPENQTIKDFLIYAEKQTGAFAPDYLNEMIFLVNYKPAKPDCILADKDLVHVLRVATGG